jgi:hypothetical protein
LILAELGPWCGWLAEKLVPWAARLRYSRGDRAAVRAEEWSDDLGNIPGQLSKLVYALAQIAAGSIVSAQRNIVHMSFGDRKRRGPVRGIIYHIPWAGVLGLLGAFVYCTPPWWIIATHYPTASAMSVAGALQALVGLWAITTFIAGPVGIIVFFGGIANSSKH